MDLDLRSAKLAVNGETFEPAFSETIIRINDIGFGIHNADKLFTNLEVQF